MYLVFLLAASTAGQGLAGPELSSGLQPDDYPIWAMQANVSAASIVELLIDPVGKVERCENKKTFENEKLASEFCKIFKRKRSQQPAHLRDGTPVYGVYRRAQKFFLPGTAQGYRVSTIMSDPEIELTVNKLPVSGVNQLDGFLTLLIDKTGAAIDCAVNKEPNKTTLPETICAYKTKIVQDIKLNNADTPIEYVIEIRVRLKLAA